MVNTRPRYEVFDNLIQKHVFVCVPPEGILTEDVVLAFGNIIGFEHVRAESRMNQKVVVFVSHEKSVHDVVSEGLTTDKGVFMLASPMDTPAVKIVVSNAPPFFPNDVLLSVLCRDGTVVSRMSMIPLRSSDKRIKHVMSFHRQVYRYFPIVMSTRG